MLLFRRPAEREPENTVASSEQEKPVEKNPDSIAIPGYQFLTLKADSKKQTVVLKNPPQNACYFKISLVLSDGTILWTSDYVEPGKSSEPITLSKELKAGTYSDTKILYQCFSMDGAFTPMNGTEIKCTLVVK